MTDRRDRWRFDVLALDRGVVDLTSFGKCRESGAARICGIEEDEGLAMLTMKHCFNHNEFVCEIGSFCASKHDDQLTFTAHEGDKFSRVAGTWGGESYDGYHLPEGHGVAFIYVMNSNGATVATYRYLYDEGSLVEPGPLDPCTAEEDGEA